MEEERKKNIYNENKIRAAYELLNHNSFKWYKLGIQAPEVLEPYCFLKKMFRGPSTEGSGTLLFLSRCLGVQTPEVLEPYCFLKDV